MYPSSASVDPALFVVGDIGVGRTWVATPYGSAPMRGASWYLHESVFYEPRIPQWAIITAIVGSILCILSLLFLLVKEPAPRGFADVTVVSGELRHTTRLFINNPFHLEQIRRQVADAQQLAAQAPEAR